MEQPRSPRHPIDRTRRRALGSIAALTVGSVAGCLSDGPRVLAPFDRGTDADDRRSIEEDFESGTYTGTFTDYHEADGEPARVTAEYAHSGGRSVLLESSPGTETSARLYQTRPVRGPVEVSVRVRKVSDGGTENSITLLLRDTNSHRRILLFASGYHGGVAARIEDRTMPRPRPVSVAPELSPNTWYRFVVRIDPDGTVECGVGDRTVSLDVVDSWQDTELTPALWVNAWGYGHPISAAFDDYHVVPLSD